MTYCDTYIHTSNTYIHASKRQYITCKSWFMPWYGFFEIKHNREIQSRSYPQLHLLIRSALVRIPSVYTSRCLKLNFALSTFSLSSKTCSPHWRCNVGFKVMTLLNQTPERSLKLCIKILNCTLFRFLLFNSKFFIPPKDTESPRNLVQSHIWNIV